MKTLSIMLLVISGVFGIAQQGWATRAYVKDSFEITLRTGPSNENKINHDRRNGRGGLPCALPFDLSC
jgi:hypothetical protein